jgi:hypothetical protein
MKQQISTEDLKKIALTHLKNSFDTFTADLPTQITDHKLYVTKIILSTINAPEDQSTYSPESIITQAGKWYYFFETLNETLAKELRKGKELPQQFKDFLADRITDKIKIPHKNKKISSLTPRNLAIAYTIEKIDRLDLEIHVDRNNSSDTECICSIVSEATEDDKSILGEFVDLDSVRKIHKDYRSKERWLESPEYSFYKMDWLVCKHAHLPFEFEELLPLWEDIYRK